MANERTKLLFFQGNYVEVLRLYQGLSSPSKMKSSELVWVLGAQAYTGRKEEALAFYKEMHLQFSSDEQTAIRFFLGVAFGRAGEFQKAQNFFIENLQSLRNKKTRPRGMGLFFAHQGVAFFRYIQSAFRKSHEAGLKALVVASHLDFEFGKAFALDLVGHSLVQMGKILAGLERLEEAVQMAQNLGNGGLVNSIQISHLVYKSQYGLNAKTALSNLLQARRRQDPQNNYGHSNLLLELANQQMLRGKLRAAGETLQTVSGLIYSTQHGRHAQLLALRLAELSYRRGELASALSAVQSLRLNLNEKCDGLHLMMALGLEVKILKALGLTGKAQPLISQLHQLAELTGQELSKQYGARLTGQPRILIPEDQIGALYQKKNNISALFASEFHGLIYDFCNLPPGSSWVVLSDQDLRVLNRGEVIVPEKLSKQGIRLLTLLFDGEKSKEQILAHVWGYTYHPLQHDALIYSAFSRLRESLGAAGDIIEGTLVGYRLRTDFSVLDLSKAHSKNKSTATQRKTLPNEGFASISDSSELSFLNTRQIKIIRLLTKKEFLRVQDCEKLFKVSAMTIKRDFAELISKGLVRRLGKARASTYTLTSRTL